LELCGLDSHLRVEKNSCTLIVPYIVDVVYWR
jgi:hypothetical protein